MFGITTFDSVPEEIVNSAYDGLVHYMADVWKGFFKYLQLKPKDVIVEVAPGSSAKIGLALEALSFKGTLYVVDPSHDSMNIIMKKYKHCLPKALIYPLVCTLTEAVDKLPMNPDYLVSNHPLDDMLLSAVAGGVSTNLFDYTSIPYQEMLKCLKDEPSLPLASVFSDWQKVIDKLQPRQTIIAQYPSLTLAQNNVHFLNELATEVLERLKQHYQSFLEPPEKIQTILNKRENYNDTHLGTQVLNAKNWMVLRFDNPKIF